MSAARQADLDWAAIGHMIRRERIKRGMNQSELGAAAGLDRKSISNYENGRAPARADRVPDGYYKVGEILGWTPDRVDSYLRGEQPVPIEPAAEAPGVSGLSPAELFPAVGRFARAAVQAGGDPRLRDLLEDAADRLLQSIPREAATQQTSYGLAAYRPHGWAEGDPGVPDDDAARIRQAIEGYERGRQQP
ncbi:helix-turn-helix domain-containing protein [Streptomyces sp. LS1784]|uniref:helix-turn-helix domain-containing protein n=1 Tax=Streptomyces sp. LS1784 TaxID=2851533 RepID=UPI001CCB83C0|nr:helix-turn-helix transcriptional regulator [Streptomyces sp. LS1784]